MIQENGKIRYDEEASEPFVSSESAAEGAPSDPWEWQSEGDPQGSPSVMPTSERPTGAPIPSPERIQASADPGFGQNTPRAHVMTKRERRSPGGQRQSRKRGVMGRGSVLGDNASRFTGKRTLPAAALVVHRVLRGSVDDILGAYRKVSTLMKGLIA